MLRLTTELKNDFYAFESMADVIRFIKPELFEPRSAGFVGEQGLTTWDAVSARADRCWAEGIYTMNEYINKLKDAELPQLKDKKRQTKFSDHDGDEVDYDKLQGGESNFWRTTSREQREGSNEVTIVIDTTTPSQKNSNDILWRGAAGIALAQILEDKGYSCEIWVVNGSQLFYGERKGVFTSCCLKRCSDPIDSSTLINVVSGWFYRTVTFTLLDSIAAHEGKKVDYGYGSCHEPTKRDLKALTPDDNVVYISGTFSFNGAYRIILDELKALAKPTTETEE